VPLAILLPLVVLGISAIVLLVRALKPTPPLVFSDPDMAREIWNHRRPNTPAQEVLLNFAGTHALVQTEEGTGILWSFGADPVARLLSASANWRQQGDVLTVRTGDFTAPKIKISLKEPSERTRWTSLLKEHA